MNISHNLHEHLHRGRLEHASGAIARWLVGELRVVGDALRTCGDGRELFPRFERDEVICGVNVTVSILGSGLVAVRRDIVIIIVAVEDACAVFAPQGRADKSLASGIWLRAAHALVGQWPVALRSVQAWCVFANEMAPERTVESGPGLDEAADVESQLCHVRWHPARLA